MTSQLTAPVTASNTLLVRVREGDNQAWELLARIYGPVVFQWGKSAGLPSELCADIVQDVFLTVFRTSDRERTGRFRSWLWRVFRSRMIDRYRKDQNEPMPSGGTTGQRYFLNIPTDLPEEDTSAVLAEKKEAVVRAIFELQGEFQPQMWECFWRVFIEGHTPQQISDDLGMTTWAVYKAKSRCQERIRKILEGMNIEFPSGPITLRG